MIYLLYGENSFGSRAKLNAIKRKFLDKYNSDNLIVKQGSELTDVNLENIFLAQTLLGGSRLIILESVLSNTDSEVKDKLLDVFSNLPQDVTVVVYESQDFDGRQKLFKFLNKPKQAQAFGALSPAALFQQVTQLAQNKSINISPILLRYLIDRVENELWTIDNELDKIAAFAQGRAVTSKDIDDLASTSIKTNVFELLGYLTKNDLKSAHKLLQDSLSQGEDEIKLMGAIAYQLRNLIRVFDLDTIGLSLQAIMKQTHLPFFVVKRSLSQIKQTSRSQLVSAYQHLILVDRQIKTGVARPADALDLMIAQKI